MDSLKTYRERLFALQGINNREDIQEVMQWVMRELIAYFWDLPASKGYHHSDYFGLLEHSLDVAFKRAVQASNRVAVDYEGNPSAEAARKQRGEKVLLAWLSGVFHDSGKILDVEVYDTSEADRPSKFEPFVGDFLGFKLKHPEENLTYEWLETRGMLHARRNLAIFMAVVYPSGLLKYFGRDQILSLFDSLMEDGDEADKESVSEVRQEQDKNFVKEAIKLFARDRFKAPDKNKKNAVRVFYLGNNIYLFINPVAFEALSNYIKKDLSKKEYDKNAVINYLINNRFIYCSNNEESSGNYFTKEKIYIAGETRISAHVSFVHGDLFSDVDVSSIPVAQIEYSDEGFERIADILGFEPAFEWFKGCENKKVYNNNDTDNEFHSKGTNETIYSEKDVNENEEYQEEKKDNIEDIDKENERNGLESQDYEELSQQSAETSDSDTVVEDNLKVRQKDQYDQQGHPERESQVGAVFVERLTEKLIQEEMILDNPDDERNIGYVSLNDRCLWLLYRPSYLKKMFVNLGISNLDEALEKLSYENILVKVNDQKVINSQTMFHRNGMDMSPKDKYIKLDISVLHKLNTDLQEII